MRDLSIFLAGCVTGGIICSLIAVVVTELRHDCMPHDPSTCKGVPTDGR